jgi:hypothetical protein
MERGQLLRHTVSYSLANDEPSLARAARALCRQNEGHVRRQPVSSLSADIDQHGWPSAMPAARIQPRCDTLEAFHEKTSHPSARTDVES